MHSAARSLPAAALLAAALLAAALLAAAAAEDTISVVEPSPERAQLLAAALDAARALPPADLAPVEPYEPLDLPRHVCDQAAAGAVAAVGSDAGAAAAARAGLPLLLVEPAAGLNASAEVVELYPHQEALAQAVAALARNKEWRKAALLHEGTASPAALLVTDYDKLQLAVRQLPPPGDDTLLRNLLLVLKKAGWVNYIVWAGAARTADVLGAAQRVGLLAERHSYLLPTLDLHTQRLHDYSYGGANITGLMLFDPESEVVQNATAAWYEAYRTRLGEFFDEPQAAQLQRTPPVALLLAHDAAVLVATARKQLALNSAAGASADCQRARGAFHADTLINFIRSEERAGASGRLAWRWDGARVPARLLVSELQRGGRLMPVGAWAPDVGLRWTRPPSPSAPPAPGSMTNLTFKVLIAKKDPYVMKTKSPFRLTGNERYEGFCVELVQQLSAVLGFNYTFVEHTEGDYNVMLERLNNDPEFEFAVTDLTITAEREKRVDFTTPFMNLGISILFRKPQLPEPDFWAFLLPFSSGVWLCLGVAYVGTSLLLYAVGRLCPDEWQNPYPCVETPPALENQFTLSNAFWFNLGAVLLQGSEIAPVAYGSRAVASAWWLFALVITSSYTANLATLLSKQSTIDVINNVQELANNKLGITYGAVEGGSTLGFFKVSQNQTLEYQMMYDQMKQWPMPKDNEEGIERVMNGSYAFLMESTTIEYIVERNCLVKEVRDLVMRQIGEHLDSKVYGIALKKNSQYRQSLNLALLKLQEKGVLRAMKHAWWKNKHGGGACKDEPSESAELEMKNFRGLWVVLAVGCALGVAVSVADLAWGAWRHPRDPAVPYARRFWSELKFVFRFGRSVKPLQGALSPTPTPSASSSDRSVRGSGGGEEEVDEADERAEAGFEPQRSVSPALSGRVRARRRSSMHTAGLRLARHASTTSTPRRHAR